MQFFPFTSLLWILSLESQLPGQKYRVSQPIVPTITQFSKKQKSNPDV